MKKTFIVYILAAIVLLIGTYTFWKITFFSPKTNVTDQKITQTSEYISTGDLPVDICKNIYQLDDKYLTLDNLKPQDLLKSPFTLTGSLSGGWCFENTCQVKLIESTEDAGILSEKTFSLSGEWTTEQLVPFSVILEFTQPRLSTGYLIFEADNPSGLDENCKVILIPVKFN